MSYFNYHAKAKNLINNGHLIWFEYMEKWNQIAPALVLFFDNNKPMPIRFQHWSEYEQIFKNLPL